MSEGTAPPARIAGAGSGGKFVPLGDGGDGGVEAGASWLSLAGIVTTFGDGALEVFRWLGRRVYRRSSASSAGLYPRLVRLVILLGEVCIAQVIILRLITRT
ncbi:hypothetical protein B0H65DRAFT_550915 [Neurospora tetraspora]|uniref:Uncharacterized protein n=1 Tax=Neurospora tetraspora TaxID=94610 RepID=A0AAE0JBW2_9PEZI|nr:hypothetical protein B0H65DRAFT_550915 [Neurospora tetraspora]